MAFVVARVPVSIRILVAVNAVSLILALVMVGGGIWLTQRPYRYCRTRADLLLLACGALLLLVSLAGLVGARRMVAGLLWVYLAFLTVALVLVAAFTIYTFVLKLHSFTSSATTTHALNHYHFNGVAFVHTFDDHHLDDVLVHPHHGDHHSHHDAAFVHPTSAPLEDPSLAKQECITRFKHILHKDLDTLSTISLVLLIILLVIYAVACTAFMHAINRNYFVQRFY